MSRANRTPANTPRRARRACLPALAWAVSVAHASAAETNEDAKQNAPADRGVWTFVLENDLFYDQDRNYTNGVRLEYATPPDGAPDWIISAARATPFFPQDADFLASFAVGQNIYTPRDIDVVPAPPDQRPYAGWLYGEVSLLGENGKRLHALKISVGVIGPASQAEQSQTVVHELLNAGEPLGWDDQLENEPALLIAYQRSWRAIETDIGPLDIEIMPHIGAAVGNVFTYANGGASLRVGWRMPRDYGVARIQPSVPGSSYYKGGQFGAYLFAGVEGRAVARNIFLDGNSFQGGPSVNRNVWVGDVQVGLALAWPRARLSYTRVFRSHEYDGQLEDDQFGAVSLSVVF